MSELLNDPVRLRRALERLKKPAGDGRASGEVNTAIAEASLRLAVHPGTSLEEAVPLVAAAVRNDPSNPKYAYHMARLCLLLDQLDAGAAWVELADRLCPSSHRIWCHASIMQMRLNARHHGDTQYEPDGLRRRAEALVEAVRSGSDDIDQGLLSFKPPTARKTPANQKVAGSEADSLDDGAAARSAGPSRRRVVNPDRCRWSGVQDLSLEQALAASPSQRQMERLLPFLRSISEDVGRRPGGAAAFAIAATEWVVSGYPVATVRRLRGGIGGETPSLRLVDAVCDLFDCDEAEVPALIAKMVSAGTIPVMLGAIIHRRRVLWRPLEFRGLGAYRAARHLATELRKPGDGVAKADDEIAKVAGERALGVFRSLKDLRRPKQVPLRDLAEREEAQVLTPEVALARFVELERAAATLIETRNRLLGYVKTELLPLSKQIGAPSDWGRAVAERSLTIAVTEALEQAGATGQAALASVKRALATTDAETFRAASSAALPDLLAGGPAVGSSDPVARFSVRADDCNMQFSALAGLGNVRKLLKKVETQLAAYPADGDPPLVEASGDLHELEQSVHESLPSWARDDEAAVAQPTAESDDGIPSLPDDPLAQLDMALSAADTALEERHGSALASLDGYPGEISAAREFRSLTAWVRGRQAETLFRLGRRRQARGRWNRMLADDRLNQDIALNIAVCDAPDRDASRSIAAWCDYFELLVIADVAAETPQPHARRRAEFLRVMADAHAADFLLADLQSVREHIDVEDAVAFLNNAARVQSFTGFRALEHLERRLALSTPTLVLGVSHSGSDRSRSEGAEALRALVEQLAPMLPPRVRNAYRALVLRHIDRVLDASTGARGVSDPHYKEDKVQLQEDLEDVVETKYRTLLLLQKAPEAAESCTSAGAIVGLAVLDRVSFSHCGDLAITAAGCFGMTPEQARAAMRENVCPTLLRGLLEQVYAQRADESRALVADLQAALTWAADQPDLVGMVEVIDDYRRGACPSDLLNEIMAALKSGHGSPGAVDRLRHMLEQVPQLTWPALLICPLLQAEERFDEAIAILDEAWANGLAPSGRIACSKIACICRWARAQAWMACLQSSQEQQERIRDDVSGLQSRAEGSAGRAGEEELAEEYATLRSAFEAAGSAARAAAQQALTDAEWVLKHTQEEEDRKAARDLRKQLKKFLKESAE